MRRFAIGDIHGCAKALRSLLETISPESDDELVFVGDYVDRGPDSRDVIDQIIALSSRCKVVSLRGNHELMLQGVVMGGLDDRVWLANGGQATVSSYGGSLSKIPSDHVNFFRNLRPFYETDTEIFVHAGYRPDCGLHATDEMTIYWAHLPLPLPAPHFSGKRVIVGHTPQPEGRVLDAGHLVCIDTYCFGGGCLTALELKTGQTLQTDRHGHVRRPPLISAAAGVKKMGRAITMYCRQQLARGGDIESEDAAQRQTGASGLQPEK